MTVHVPLALLPQVAATPAARRAGLAGAGAPAGTDRGAAALIAQGAAAQLHPADHRRRRKYCPTLDPGEPLLDGLERALRRRTGVSIPREAWQLDKLPPDLRPTFAVQDAAGEVVATGKDLAELRSRLAPAVRAAVAQAGGGLERAGLRDWPGGTLPRTVSQEVANGVITAYPALVDRRDAVDVQILASAQEQERAMWAGTRRLLMLTTPSPVKAITARLGTRAKLVLWPATRTQACGAAGRLPQRRRRPAHGSGRRPGLGRAVLEPAAGPGAWWEWLERIAPPYPRVRRTFRSACITARPIPEDGECRRGEIHPHAGGARRPGADKKGLGQIDKKGSIHGARRASGPGSSFRPNVSG